MGHNSNTGRINEMSPYCAVRLRLMLWRMCSRLVVYSVHLHSYISQICFASSSLSLHLHVFTHIEAQLYKHDIVCVCALTEIERNTQRER